MADSIIDKLKQQFRQGSVLLKLIYINVAIFLLLRLTWVVLMLFNIDGYVILPFIEMPSIPYEFITVDSAHIHVRPLRCMAHSVQHALAILVRANISHVVQ